jgi:hypothetical protein
VKAIDTEARARGLSLLWIRAALRMRHDRSATRSLEERRDRHRTIRTNVSYLRALGPGPVERVETGGGVLLVPETWWGPTRPGREARARRETVPCKRG